MDTGLSQCFAANETVGNVLAGFCHDLFRVSLGLVDHGLGFLVGILLATLGEGKRLSGTFAQVAGFFQLGRDGAGPIVQATQNGLEGAHTSSDQEEDHKCQEGCERHRIGERIGQSANEALTMTGSVAFFSRKGWQGRTCSQYAYRHEIFHRAHVTTPAPR